MKALIGGGDFVPTRGQADYTRHKRWHDVGAFIEGERTDITSRPKWQVQGTDPKAVRRASHLQEREILIKGCMHSQTRMEEIVVMHNLIILAVKYDVATYKVLGPHTCPRLFSHMVVLLQGFIYCYRILLRVGRICLFTRQRWERTTGDLQRRLSASVRAKSCHYECDNF